MIVGEMTDPDNVMNPLHFATDPADIRIRINPKIWIRIPDQFWLKFWWKRTTSTTLGRHELLVTLQKWLTSMDSGSLFRLIHHCGIGDFWTFVSISYTINGRFLW